LPCGEHKKTMNWPPKGKKKKSAKKKGKNEAMDLGGGKGKPPRKPDPGRQPRAGVLGKIRKKQRTGKKGEGA